MQQSLEFLKFAFLWHCPFSKFFLPSSLADHFSFFSYFLFLSAVVCFRGALPCLGSTTQGSLAYARAGGEHLFSRWWPRLLSALEVYESHCCSQPGLHTLMYVSRGRVESRDRWSRWLYCWKGSSFLILHFLNYSFTWRCPCILLKDKDSDPLLKMRMSNLKDYNACNDLALCLSFLEHFVILVNENYTSFIIVIIDLIHFFSLWRAWVNSLPLCWHKTWF